MRRKKEPDSIYPPNKSRLRWTSLFALLCTALLLTTTLSVLIDAGAAGPDDGGDVEGGTTFGGLVISKIAGLVTNALGAIGVINKVDNAGDAAKIMKVVDEATDSAGLTKYVVKYSDEASGLERVVGSFDEMAQAQGAVKALQKMGPKADILKNSDALKILGKSDNLQWTKKQITALDEIIRDGGKAGGKFEGLNVDLVKMEKLANVEGFNSVLSRINSKWDFIKSPWTKNLQKGRIQEWNNILYFSGKYGDNALMGINKRIPGITMNGKKTWLEADGLFDLSKNGDNVLLGQEYKTILAGSKYVKNQKQITKMAKAIDLTDDGIDYGEIVLKFDGPIQHGAVDDLIKSLKKVEINPGEFQSYTDKIRVIVEDSSGSKFLILDKTGLPNPI